tara:strand:- start:441 stop:665 length:225 start_codon:yes stop_codon:yes gene_type:complete
LLKKRINGSFLKLKFGWGRAFLSMHDLSNNSSNKEERLLAPLPIIPFDFAKIAVVCFRKSKGSKEFQKASFPTF